MFALKCYCNIIDKLITNNIILDLKKRLQVSIIIAAAAAEVINYFKIVYR